MLEAINAPLTAPAHPSGHRASAVETAPGVVEPNEHDEEAADREAHLLTKKRAKNKIKFRRRHEEDRWEHSRAMDTVRVCLIISIDIFKPRG